MKVYAIHRENTFTTDYNVVIYSSKRHAQKILKELNEPYRSYSEIKKSFASNYNNPNYIDWLYENPTPSRYRIEELIVVKNEKLSKRL